MNLHVAILAILSITLSSRVCLASGSTGNLRRAGSLRRRGVLYPARTSQQTTATTINSTTSSKNNNTLRRRQLNQDPTDQDLDDDEKYLATTSSDDDEDLPSDASLFSGDALQAPESAVVAGEQEGDGFGPAEYEDDDYYKLDDDSFDDDGAEYYAYLEEKLESTNSVSEQAGQI